MTQFESAYQEFTKRNASVIFIAGQKIDGLFKGKEHVHRRKYPFPILFDEQREVTRAYGPTACIKLSVSTRSTWPGDRCSLSGVKGEFARSR